MINITLTFYFPSAHHKTKAANSNPNFSCYRSQFLSIFLHYRKEPMTDQIESEDISAVLYDVVKHPSAFDVSQKLREVCHGYHSS